jgi:hypothetical protein
MVIRSTRSLAPVCQDVTPQVRPVEGLVDGGVLGEAVVGGDGVVVGGALGLAAGGVDGVPLGPALEPGAATHPTTTKAASTEAADRKARRPEERRSIMEASLDDGRARLLPGRTMVAAKTPRRRHRFLPVSAAAFTRR